MPVWQPRFYDFNVWTERKRVEKLRSMHGNPVKRGLVEEPAQWVWSSFRYYDHGQVGRVRVNDCDIMRMRETARVAPAPAPCEKAARSGAPKTEFSPVKVRATRHDWQRDFMSEETKQYKELLESGTEGLIEAGDFIESNLPELERDVTLIVP
jgi:hypothetical protein